MGWRVEPSDGVMVMPDGSVTFPTNETDADKRYRVIYEDERGCSGETEFTVHAGNHQNCRITVSQNQTIEDITYKFVDANGNEYTDARYTGRVEESEAIHIEIPSNEVLYLLVEAPEGWISNYDEIEGHDPLQCDGYVEVILKPIIHITPHVCQSGGYPRFYFTTDRLLNETLTLHFDGRINFGPTNSESGSDWEQCHGTQYASGTVFFNTGVTESESKEITRGEGQPIPPTCNDHPVVAQGGDYDFGDYGVAKCGFTPANLKERETTNAKYIIVDRINDGSCEEITPTPSPEVSDEIKLTSDIGEVDGNAVIGWRAGSAPIQPILIKTFALIHVYNPKIEEDGKVIREYEDAFITKEVEVIIPAGQTSSFKTISPSEVGWDRIDYVESVCVEDRWIGTYYVADALECED